MTHEFFTFVFVPHAKGRPRKFQVSLKLTKWLGGTLVGASLVMSGILVHYTWVTTEVRTLRKQNQVLRSRTVEYEQNAGKLQAKVSQLQGLVMKLGVMAGLEHSLPEPDAGVGGVSSIDSLTPAASGASLQVIDKSLEDLTARGARLEAFYRDQKALLSSTPSVWPVRGYLSASFGNRVDPFTGQRDFHTGIDISTPLGARIQAPADGLVVSAGPQGGYGNALVIDHGYGVVTRYGHMASFNVRPGQRVRRGDVIGFVGNTGRSTGPHLHYEVWLRDRAQNPIHFILDEYRTFG